MKKLIVGAAVALLSISAVWANGPEQRARPTWLDPALQQEMKALMAAQAQLEARKAQLMAALHTSGADWKSLVRQKQVLAEESNALDAKKQALHQRVMARAPQELKSAMQRTGRAR